MVSESQMSISDTRQLTSSFVQIDKVYSWGASLHCGRWRPSNIGICRSSLLGQFPQKGILHSPFGAIENGLLLRIMGTQGRKGTMEILFQQEDCHSICFKGTSPHPPLLSLVFQSSEGLQNFQEQSFLCFIQVGWTSCRTGNPRIYSLKRFPTTLVLIDLDSP